MSYEPDSTYDEAVGSVSRGRAQHSPWLDHVSEGLAVFIVGMAAGGLLVALAMVVGSKAL